MSFRIKLARYSLVPIAVLMSWPLSSFAKDASLSRTKAKEILLKGGLSAKEQVGTLLIGTIRAEQWQIPRCQGYTDFLTKSGLAIVKVSNSTRNAGIAGVVPVVVFDVTPTEVLQKLITSVERFPSGASKASVVAWKSKLGEVTGISFANAEKTVALVEYQINYEISPLAGLTDCESFVGKPPAVTNGKAMLRMYDDGWRIIQN